MKHTVRIILSAIMILSFLTSLTAISSSAETADTTAALSQPNENSSEENDATENKHTYYLGDADGNGHIEICDVTYLQRYLASLSPIVFEDCIKDGDVDENGVLETTDATLIQRWLTEPECQYDIGKALYEIRKTDWSFPLRGFVWLGKNNKANVISDSINISYSEGKPVYAANGGTVVSCSNSCSHQNNAFFCDCSGGFGNYVWILHDNGFETVYANLLSTTVQEGDRVEASELLGYIGSTGYTRVPQLHFELRINGIKRNPLMLYN